jgi:hypothetical protein
MVTASTLALRNTITRRRTRRRMAVVAAVASSRKHRVLRALPFQRTRMVWRDRVASLTAHEFVCRYRVDLEGFNSMLVKIRPFMPAMYRNVTNQVSNELKLSMCLRWLAGGSYLDLADMHGVSTATFFRHVKQVYTAINQAYELPLVGVLERWDVDAVEQLASGFDAKTHGVVPGCIGAIDGIALKVERKVVAAEPAPDAFFTHKGFYSLNGQVICDAYRRITWASIKCCGSTHDATAFSNTRLAELMGNPAHPINASDYWIAGDDAYVGPANQCDSLLTPYQGRNLDKWHDSFNFYQSKLRIEIECTFGGLVHRFGMLQRKLAFDCVDDACTALMAMFKIHNIATDRRVGLNHVGRVPVDRDPSGKTRLGDLFGADWAQWGPDGVDAGFHDPDDRPRVDRSKKQRLRDELHDNLRIAGWTRPDRSTYLGYREAAQRSAVARM